MKFIHTSILFTIFISVIFPVTGIAQVTENDSLNKRPGTEVPCARYWSGPMKYTDEAYFGIKVLRKGKKQIEINPETRSKTIFKIKWNADCKYTLTFIKSNQPTRFKKGWTVDVEITDAYDEFCDFKSDLHGIISYGTIQKELSAKEKKQQAKQERDSSKKALKDSIRIAKSDTLNHKFSRSDSLGNNSKSDSLTNKSKGDKPEGKKEKVPKEKKEKPGGKNESGDDAKPKKEKKQKVKKDKPPKEE